MIIGQPHDERTCTCEHCRAISRVMRERIGLLPPIPFGDTIPFGELPLDESADHDRAFCDCSDCENYRAAKETSPAVAGK